MGTTDELVYRYANTEHVPVEYVKLCAYGHCEVMPI